MAPWSRGQSAVDQLIADGTVQRLPGADQGVGDLLDRADRMLGSAALLLESDPVTAYVVAYDAAKHAGMALLAEQDLRAVGGQSHVAIEKTLSAQFEGVFERFSRLRRRRNELDYPQPHEALAGEAEAEKALQVARLIVEDARELVRRGVLTTY